MVTKKFTIMQRDDGMLICDSDMGRLVVDATGDVRWRRDDKIAPDDVFEFECIHDVAELLEYISDV